ncbi:hypothetical protein QBZ16_001739 [Prototheca wickerhamii]|uniref:Semialdehyde dehydrogenase NAD-binding domain-containing protein n=1 Tax=Prototheca wickerhamii TaxID=3111 RepID=A0AAD9MLM3_PROWI|nr:hypothetical protein QBZ16_001739 [Prototheca wickerhamii]
MTGDRQAGKEFSEIDDVDWAGVDAVFCCLPHATTQAVVAGLPGHIKVVDLSADFRLRDPAVYAEWYGGEHKAVELQREVAYGLTELHREAVKDARVVANPGCYPTSVQLPLATEGINAYGVGRHRHMPEIEQGLSDAAGEPVKVSFTPHLMPMTRGMESDCYVRLAEGIDADDLRAELARRYADEPFVHVLPEGAVPHTHHVRGTNFNQIAVFKDRLPGRAVVVSVIDNLVKGASGQAVQNLNLMFGLPETTALMQQALFP